MTDPKHPLTDEICDQITDELSFFSIEDCMRSGADWQLEQVIEWLQANLWLYDDETGPMYIKEDFLSDKVIDEEKVIEDLKKEMRPQQQENQ